MPESHLAPSPQSPDIERTADSPSSSDSVASAHGRFLPGTLFGNRFRIVELLGRGGMGEVYRADDLEIGQAVALKFIPAALANDPAELARLRREVRLARQLSHPNICRVFDIGNIEGHYFLTMEYIDGEDLASVLRRLGRPSPEKGIQISRQVCAGLAAAHESGILHRDLKPANVMIDGRGRVRLMDFGLSSLIADAAQNREPAGTPIYMAPEQLEGSGLSTRTDIYALGLLLYELLTGRRAFAAERISDLRDVYRKHTAPAPLSRWVPEIDPEVEKMVLRCLAPEPHARPASALEVATAFPATDAIAEAIAAGDTPSPELIAAAGGEGGLSPRAGWVLLLLTILALSACIVLAKKSTVAGLAPASKSPAVLLDYARNVIQATGYGKAKAADEAYGSYSNYTYLQYLAKREDSRVWRKNLADSEPGAARFWYRQSPLPLEPYNVKSIVDREDPPVTYSGMILILFDWRGSLRLFRAVPEYFESGASQQVQAVDWVPLFRAAGINESDVKATSPVWLTNTPYDARYAWEGTRQGQPIRIDAASFHGRPVYFDVNGPWYLPSTIEIMQPGLAARVGETTFVAAALTIIVLGLILARRNLRLHRGNRRAAFRLCVFYFILAELAWLLSAHLYFEPSFLWNAIALGVGTSLFGVAFLWISYMAVDPYARRYWPDILISWSRLAEGRLADPLVGRDVLIGCFAGALTAAIVHFAYALPNWFNITHITPIQLFPLALGTPLQALGKILSHQMEAIISGLAATLVLVFGRLLLRSRWGAVIFWIVAQVLIKFMAENVYVQLALSVVTTALLTFLLIRFGVLTYVTTLFVAETLVHFPLTMNLTQWYGGRSLLVVGLVSAIAVISFLFAIARQNPFSWILSEE